MSKTPHILSIIIPCYNEVRTIQSVLEKVRTADLPEGWGREIIVVDDGSKDGTREILESIGNDIRVIYRAKNGGKGAAVKDGLRSATGDFCIIQDADLELNPQEFPSLLEPIESGDAEAVFGYRIVGKDVAEDTTLLFLGGRMVSLFYNIAFFTRFRDIPCCYKLFPTRCVPELLATPSQDFVFDAVEMTRVISQACTVAQVPVQYAPRTRAQGKKIMARHGIYCLIAIVLLRLGLHHKPLDVEVPRIFRYLVAGFATVAVNIAILYVLTDSFGIWYLSSSTVAFLGSYIVNFTLQKYWTFGSRSAKHLTYELPLHLSLALINLGVNAAILYVLVEYAHMWYILAEIIGAAFVAAESFILLSRFIFNRS